MKKPTVSELYAGLGPSFCSRLEGVLLGAEYTPTVVCQKLGIAVVVEFATQTGVDLLAVLLGRQQDVRVRLVRGMEAIPLERWPAVLRRAWTTANNVPLKSVKPFALDKEFLVGFRLGTALARRHGFIPKQATPSTPQDPTSGDFVDFTTD